MFFMGFLQKLIKSPDVVSMKNPFTEEVSEQIFYKKYNLLSLQ